MAPRMTPEAAAPEHHQSFFMLACADKPEAAPAAHATGDNMQASPAPSSAMQLPEAASGTATTVRSFKDVFAKSLERSDDVKDDLLDAGPALGATEVSAAAAAAVGTEGTSARQEQTAGEKMISPDFGYAAIGGRVPTRRDAMDSLAQHPRLHPRRTFQPGQTYLPEVRILRATCLASSYSKMLRLPTRCLALISIQCRATQLLCIHDQSTTHIDISHICDETATLLTCLGLVPLLLSLART